jgi:hypothetical protein
MGSAAKTGALLRHHVRFCLLITLSDTACAAKESIRADGTRIVKWEAG